MSFVHLHTHSNYSLLDGLSKIDEMVAKAKRLGMPALALTDHGNLYGAIEFYKTCRAKGVKPIIGVEAYIALRSRHNKEPNIDNKRYHLTLLAKNRIGYQNLIKLVSTANLEGYYYKPRMDKELLAEHHEGIICLSGCMASELGRALQQNNQSRGEEIIKEHQEIFGRENYFLEIMHHPKIETQTAIKLATIELSKKLKIPLVATHDSHYLEPDDAKAHDTLVAIQQNNFDDNKRFSAIGEDFSFITPEEAVKLFSDTPEAVANTLRVAELCSIELELGKWVFPNYPLPKGENYDQLLVKQAEKYLVNYLINQLENPATIKTRLAYELEVIIKKGYSPYFLVVADIIDYARSQGIFTNTRGSAAGSLVSYLLGITGVDPLVYKLPFERFLNPDRPSPPDIDMDFADKRRDEVINYVKQKYGEDKVAQIGTFGSMMARGAVRDVARALGFPYAAGDRIANLIPMGSQGFPMTIERALELTPELKKIYDEEPETKQIINLAKKIEGGVRHISVHAAGVVIAPTTLTDFVPLQLDPKGGKIITQYDMYAVEEAGLLKLDFLGIRNLSILEDSIRLVKKIHGLEIDIEKIPLDDKKTFTLLARGETLGLFQLNGSGMTKCLKELRPTTIHDINVMVALYRPGPMDNINEYIARKHGQKPIKFLHPKMKNFLETTYGVLVYQDDLLLTAIEVAGYSWGEVDKFRKAVGKKIPEEMAKQHLLFVDGCVKNGGMKKEKAEELWNLFEPFQGYGFNKAHAASYGKVAYQTAYMKANYPAEYMTAVLSAEAGDMETISEIIKECVRMGLPVLPPDINESFGDFTVVKGAPSPDNATGHPAAGGVRRSEAGEGANADKIRFGLFTIKNLGEEISSVIVGERKKNGPFRSIPDFLERITHRNLNKKSLEALTQAGAFDSLRVDRATILGNLERLLTYNRDAGIDHKNQESLFAAMADTKSVPTLKLEPAPRATRREKLIWEKELLGLYISGHPLDDFRDKFTDGNSIKKAKGQKADTPVMVGGLIEEMRPIVTKKGDRMAFFKLADFTDRIEVVVFSRSYDQYKEFLVAEKCVAIRGKLSLRNGEPSIILESVKELG
ncbi:MAG: DNA polymerase III subunit alpha [Patescibacteria group bacterium]